MLSCFFEKYCKRRSNALDYVMEEEICFQVVMYLNIWWFNKLNWSKEESGAETLMSGGEKYSELVWRNTVCHIWEILLFKVIFSNLSKILPPVLFASSSTFYLLCCLLTSSNTSNRITRWSWWCWWRWYLGTPPLPKLPHPLISGSLVLFFRTTKTMFSFKMRGKVQMDARWPSFAIFFWLVFLYYHKISSAEVQKNIQKLNVQVGNVRSYLESTFTFSLQFPPSPLGKPQLSFSGPFFNSALHKLTQLMNTCRW